MTAIPADKTLAVRLDDVRLENPAALLPDWFYAGIMGREGANRFRDVETVDQEGQDRPRLISAKLLLRTENC